MHLNSRGSRRSRTPGQRAPHSLLTLKGSLFIARVPMLSVSIKQVVPERAEMRNREGWEACRCSRSRPSAKRHGQSLLGKGQLPADRAAGGAARSIACNGATAVTNHVRANSSPSGLKEVWGRAAVRGCGFAATPGYRRSRFQRGLRSNACMRAAVIQCMATKRTNRTKSDLSSPMCSFVPICALCGHPL